MWHSPESNFIVSAYACSAPSHYLTQCWNIVNWNLRNKLQQNFNRNWNIFIKKNAFENVVHEMAAILSWPQCVNISLFYVYGYAVGMYPWWWIYLGIQKKYFYISFISQKWNGADRWNLPPLKTRTSLSYRVSIMVADDPAKKESGISSNGIDFHFLVYFSFNTRRVDLLGFIGN